VQEQLQREARQDSFAKAFIRSHLTGADLSTSATSVTSASTRTSRSACH
jgi:hypothetical protein